MAFDRAAHCRRIASKGGLAVVKKYGKTYMQNLGKKGFQSTCQKYFDGDRQKMIDDLVARGVFAVDYAARDYEWYWQAENPGPHPAHIEQYELPIVHTTAIGYTVCTNQVMEDSPMEYQVLFDLEIFNAKDPIDAVQQFANIMGNGEQWRLIVVDEDKNEYEVFAQFTTVRAVEASVEQTVFAEEQR